jgi:hypothetical protein
MYIFKVKIIKDLNYDLTGAVDKKKQETENLLRLFLLRN